MTNDKQGRAFLLNAKRFRDQLKALTPFMSVEEARYYLNGIHFKYDGKDLLAVATNGHILCEAAIEHEGGGAEPFDAICPREAISTLCRMLKEASGNLQVSMSVTGGTGKRFVFDNFDMQLTAKELSGKFPDYEAVIPRPNHEKTIHHDRFNSGYVRAVLDAFPSAPINIFTEGADTKGNLPHLITSDQVKGLRCVMMPMRTEE